MSIKDTIEKHPVVIFLGALVAGFITGFGAYKAIIEISGQVLLPKSSYEITIEKANKVESLELTIKDLVIKLRAAEEENQWYVIAASVKTSDDARIIVSDLKQKGIDAKYLLKDGSTHIAVYVGEKIPRKAAWHLLLQARKAGYPDAYMWPQNFVAERYKASE